CASFINGGRDVSDNEISELEGEAFEGLTSLTTLSISNNPIENIDPDTLALLQALLLLSALGIPFDIPAEFISAILEVINR
ncbi:unnamed protein product, partial [Ectocarpus fasciculatus]